MIPLYAQIELKSSLLLIEVWVVSDGVDEIAVLVKLGGGHRRDELVQERRCGCVRETTKPPEAIDFVGELGSLAFRIHQSSPIYD